MTQKRRKHSNEFKAKVALEAVKGVHTLSELSSRYQVHPTVIGHWKRQLLDGAAEVFENGHRRHKDGNADEVSTLYEEIGRLTVERDWLKKKL
jgi:transposase-like protein